MKKPSAKRRPVKTSQRAGDDASTSKVPAVARPALSDAENRQPQPGEKRRPSAPRIKIIAARDGAIHITADHPPDPAIDQILPMEELGTTDIDFLNGLLGQLADVGTQGRWSSIWCPTVSLQRMRALLHQICAATLLL